MGQDASTGSGSHPGSRRNPESRSGREKVCQYSGKIVCATVLTIPRSVMDQINDYLNADTEDAYQGEDNTITYTAHFPDGKEMDVKCCGCRDESSWTERFSSIKTC